MTRPIVWLFFGAAAVLGVTACSDSSDEIAALQAQVAELQEQVSQTTTRAPTLTRPTTTTRAPATTRATTTTRAPATTQTQAPATTRASAITHTFSDAEVSSLRNMCAKVGCPYFIQQAVGAGFFETILPRPNPSPRLCNYSEVKAWINSKKYDDPEWPLFVERECGPYK